MNAMQEHLGRLVLAILVLISCATPVLADENPAPADPTLLPVFEQFGGKPGIDALMEDFMIKLIEDPRTRNYFAEADQTHIKAMLAEWEREQPGRVDNVFRALTAVVPSHLADQALFDFRALGGSDGEGVRDWLMGEPGKD